ncbi:MAG: enolase C-terminal domain-like protein [Anaerolineae bacterium]
MEVVTRPYTLPLRRAFATGAGAHTVRRGMLVGVRLPGGVTGWGEAAPLEGHGGEAASTLEAALAEFAAAVADPDAERLILGTPPGWAPLHALSRRLFPRPDGRPCARAAFDLALADALARRDGLPLARWLSRAARPRVALNAVIDAVDPDEAAVRAAAAVADGFGTLKVKLTSDAAADERRLAAIREAAGPAAALRGDANGRWTVDESIAPARSRALRPGVRRAARRRGGRRRPGPRAPRRARANRRR